MTESARRILTAWQEVVRVRGNIPFKTSELHGLCAPSKDPAAFSRLLKDLRVGGYASVASTGPHGQHNLQLTTIGETYSGCDLVGKLPSPQSLRDAQDCAESRNGQTLLAARDTTESPSGKEVAA